ncbi:MAG: leucyl/phenylalanyl-tRNA--protein transferase [Alphaproteobacteria bacterium]|nr:leucyl/phenylalanyl-tRNA--protein transferase [Alphaproteobacteria bacterium]
MPDYRDLTPAILLKAYSIGIFPMAYGRHSGEFDWIEPPKRGIIPLDGLHISRSLAKAIRQNPFTVTYNQAFPEVMEACASREETWISDDIIRVYTELHRQGFADSIECWDKDGMLVGGLYGVRLHHAFFGESMFSRRTNASKIALYHLVEKLKKEGFMLLDTQFITPHLASLGGIEIPKSEYLALLRKALS